MSDQKKASRPFIVDFFFYLVVVYLAAMGALALVGVTTWGHVLRDLGLFVAGAILAGGIAGLFDTVRTTVAHRRVVRAVQDRIAQIEREKTEAEAPRTAGSSKPTVPLEDAPFTGGPF